jgi:RimJ/RimL family protein N-acetyltransferase
MTELDDPSTVINQRQEQMLRLVTKGFYNELINYGVTANEVLSVAGHLLDNVMQKGGPTNKQADYYNRLFSVRDVRDDWATAQRLTVQQVSISPLAISHIPRIVAWLREPAIRDSFYPRFPDSEEELTGYVQEPTREYFSIFHEHDLVGIIGAEQIDRESAKLEMRKLVGDARMHGKGIGKLATFLFLYHAFVIRKFRKVFIYSMDVNVRNLNLNGRFGFELEGVFFENALVQNTWRDVVRMSLSAPVWLELFAQDLKDA